MRLPRLTSPLPFRSTTPKQNRSAWLYRELRQAILDGALKPGAPVPATRALARDHRLSRGTVVAVYEQLIAEGYLQTRRGSGTLVANTLPDTLKRVVPTPTKPQRNGPTPISCVPRDTPFPLAGRSMIRAFCSTVPSVREFPVSTWARLSSRRIRLSGTRLLAEGDVQGYLPLRAAIATHVGATRGVACTAEDIAIVSGTQHALDLFARLLLQRDDPVWVEHPGYLGAVSAFRNFGARIIPVPVDTNGLDVAAGIRARRNAKLAYVTPAHQMPLGSTLSATRRLALLKWATEVGAYVFEDDYDSEFRFRGRPLAALKALDTDDRVILAGSFAKMLFASIRLGYVVIPAPLREGFLRLRSAVDRHPAVIDQAVLADFIVEGHFGSHLRRMRLIYAERRLALLRHLEPLSPWIHLLDTPAGLQTVARLRKNRPESQLVERAARNGIELMPLSRFFYDGNPVHGFILGFAPFTPSEIAQAARRLEETLRNK